jgi:hypothetical protein
MAFKLVERGVVSLDKLEELSIDDVDEFTIWQNAHDDAMDRLTERKRREAER